MGFEVVKRSSTWQKVKASKQGRWCLENTGLYFKEATKVISPSVFGDCLKELLQIAHNGENEAARIQAISLIVKTFMPKNWMEVQAAAATEKDKIIEYTPEFLKVLADQANHAVHQQASEAEKSRDADTQQSG